MIDIDNWKVGPQDQRPKRSDAQRAAVDILKAAYSTRLAELAAQPSWTQQEGCEIVHMAHIYRILESFE